jgi:hypothetical protein
MNMKKFFLALLGAALLAAAPVAAQVNTVPQVGVTSAYVPKVTYSAGFIGLIPAAATTDLLCLAGSATKTIKLQSIKISGSGTAISVPATLVKRTSADTGGTAASTTANPANNISKRDSSYPTATAVPIAYTANPTIVDSTPTYIDSANLGVVATTVGLIAAPTVFNFGIDDNNLLQPPVLRGVAEQICVNLNATSATALLSGSITWTEE